MDRIDLTVTRATNNVTHPRGQPRITLSGVTLRMGGRWVVKDLDWQIRQGENWVIWGPNGAGKSTLAKALLGQVAVVRGQILHHTPLAEAVSSEPRATAMVSGEQFHQLIQHEHQLDDMRAFSGRVNEATTVADLVGKYQNYHPKPEGVPRRLAPEELLGSDLWSKPIAVLSSGEMRRLLIVRALLRDPGLLMLDEPFNGLDHASCAHLAQMLGHLHATGTQMVLICHRLGEIPPFFDHLLHIEQGHGVWQGPLAAFLELNRHSESPPLRMPPLEVGTPLPADGNRPPLIRLRDVTVGYGPTLVLRHVDWTVGFGEHWALTGPNGSGKTTLLNLITGDNLQAYANEVEVCGHRKGAGQTVWQIRQQIGLVNDALQARFQRRMSGFEVVCSGFHDSVGLYRVCTQDQRRAARDWIERLALTDLAEQPYQSLSFGQQRMLLVARAMVKSPRLLILDEPCNGLDRANRQRLLDILDRIGRDRRSTLLYVTHRPDEMPGCITHRLCLEAGRVVYAGSISAVHV